MKVLDIQQGSDEWLLVRSRHRCASDAPAIMGASPHITRNQMIHAKKTMQDREFADFVQKFVIDKGHDVEAKARVIIEAQIGEDLFPIIGVDDSGVYLASFDGMPMGESFSWECKQWAKELADQISKGELGPLWYWQAEHQLLVNGAGFVKFTVSDGTPEKTISMDYYPVPGRREQLIRGWDQFDADVEAYVPQAPKAEVVPAQAKTLPAISYKLNGLALTSNLAEYKQAASQLVEESKKVLQTDQDFADREALIKGFKVAEEKIKLIKEQVVGEIKDVAAFSNELTDIAGLIRQARLNSEKQVEARKEEIRLNIERGASTAFKEHVAKINKRLDKVQLPAIEANFFAVMKGKKTVASLQNAADTLLSQLKIQASEIADKIEANIRTLRQVGDYEFLFADMQQLVLKAPDDLRSLIKVRIHEHQEEERKKEERIREDERIKAEKAAREKLEREQAAEKSAKEKADREAAQLAAEEAERQRKAAEAEKKPEPPVAQTEQPRPAAVGKQAAKPQAAAPAPAQQKPTRPTDDQIIEVLALHYRVHESKIMEWLLDMDLEAAGNRMVEDEFPGAA